MSSRALRKLEKLRQRDEGLKNEEAAEDDGEELLVEKPKATNLFALIGGDGDEDGSENGSESDGETPGEKVEQEEEFKLPTKSQKKKSKKKNKKKSKANKAFDDEEDEEQPDDDDELDKILQELNIKEETKNTSKGGKVEEEDNELDLNITHEVFDATFKYFTPLKQFKCRHLLSFDEKNLDPDNEFQKLFGSLSKEAIRDANETTSTSIPPEQLKQIKKLARLVRGWGGSDKRSVPGSRRKLIMTKIRDDWVPTTTKEVSMEEIDDREMLQLKLSESEDWADVIKDDIEQYKKYGIKFYKFERSASAKLANTKFFISVIIQPNHENLMHLLAEYPYHVETILQVALILVRQGDKSNSNGLIERALFVFDRGFKQNLELGNGLTRLPFHYYMNRQFCLALFRYIDVLTKKGTFETAFTYAKLLLSLSPGEDPYGVRYFMDFYAILSGNFKYLIEFIDSPLVITYRKWLTPSLAYSKALCYLHLNDYTNAKQSLKEAFILYPFTGYKLLETIGLASDIPVKDYSVFEVQEEIELLTQCYVIRASIMWEKIEFRNFLHDNLMEFIAQGIKLNPVKGGIIPLNLVRFVILSGESKLMAKLPKEIWDDNDVYEYDVKPSGELLEDFIDERSIIGSDIINGVEDQFELDTDLAREISLFIDGGGAGANIALADDTVQPE